MKKKDITGNNSKTSEHPKSSSKSNKIKHSLKSFWRYIWYDDSFGSYIANFLVAFIIIKYLLFPGLGFILNNDYPVVAIVSGSMEHKIVNGRICNHFVVDTPSKNLDLENYWDLCGSYYESNYNISSNQFEEFEYKNGLNIGDVMVLYGSKPENIEVGEVLVFVPQDKRFFETKGPVIHRVVEKWQDDEGMYHFRTKGDHNPQSFENFENDITEENIIGVGAIRVPFIGYAKIAINEIFLKIISLVN